MFECLKLQTYSNSANSESEAPTGLHLSSSCPTMQLSTRSSFREKFLVPSADLVACSAAFNAELTSIVMYPLQKENGRRT